MYALPLLVGGLIACSSTGPIEGKLSNNGLLLNFDAVDALVTAPLGSANGDGSEILLDEDAFAMMLGAPGGLELLTYLSVCALGEEQELVVESSGFRARGNLALATSWANTECDGPCQRWVSACLLAHANAFDNPVAISPRGAHPSLTWNDALADKFNYEEAAFYGNLFLPEDERILVACGGTGLQDHQDISAEAFLSGRLCGASNCGLEFPGICRDPNLVIGEVGFDANICRSDDKGYYEDCAIEVDMTGELNGNVPRIDEVITIFLDF